MRYVRIARRPPFPFGGLGFSAFQKPPPSTKPVWSAFAVYTPPTTTAVVSPIPTASAPAAVEQPAVAQVSAQQNVPLALNAQTVSNAPETTVTIAGGGSAAPLNETYALVDPGSYAFEAPPDESTAAAPSLSDGWGLSSWLSNLSGTEWLLLLAAGFFGYEALKSR